MKKHKIKLNKTQQKISKTYNCYELKISKQMQTPESFRNW